MGAKDGSKTNGSGESARIWAACVDKLLTTLKGGSLKPLKLKTEVYSVVEVAGMTGRETTMNQKKVTRYAKRANV